MNAFFLDSETDRCTIYENRPLQCRAQACWDESQARQIASKHPYLTREHLFKSVELLLGLIREHDQRCAFKELSEEFKRLEETKGGSVEAVLKLLAFEEHYRHFFAEKLNIPMENLDLVFGRSFADLVHLFGFKVRKELDGTRCLLQEDDH